MPSLRDLYVRTIYADHNRSRAVRERLAALTSSMEAGKIGLNVGSGAQPRIHPRVLNLDVGPHANVDIAAPAERLPFRTGSFDLVISQECLEHVADPFAAMSEIARVLRPGGRLYLQLPFVIGYHPGPSDYWRFTKQGIEELAKSAGMRVDGVTRAVGSATGFYRISVEFWAVLLAMPLPRLYHPLKGLVALALFPLKWVDPLLDLSPQRDRIPGRYLLVATKIAGVDSPLHSLSVPPPNPNGS